VGPLEYFEFDDASKQKLKNILNVTFRGPCFLVNFRELALIQEVNFEQNSAAINCPKLKSIDYVTCHNAFEISECPEFEQFSNTTFTGSALPNPLTTLLSTQLTSLGGITFSARTLNLSCCYALKMSADNTSVIRRLIESGTTILFPAHFCAQETGTGYTAATQEKADYLSQRNLLLFKASFLLYNSGRKRVKGPEYPEKDTTFRIPPHLNTPQEVAEWLATSADNNQLGGGAKTPSNQVEAKSVLRQKNIEWIQLPSVPRSRCTIL
jgi:hypothetical protein